jgi:antitoxin FitA
MSKSITLKNIPEPIYQRVKLAAKRHHRSMNNEIIACLEQVLAPQAVDVESRLEEARRLRAQFTGPALTIEDIARAIDRGARDSAGIICGGRSDANVVDYQQMAGHHSGRGAATPWLEAR